MTQDEKAELCGSDHRLIEYGEKLLAEDEIWLPKQDMWARICGQAVGNPMADNGYLYRRKLAVHTPFLNSDRTVLTLPSGWTLAAGDGWRFLEPGETLRKEDERCNPKVGFEPLSFPPYIDGQVVPDHGFRIFEPFRRRISVDLLRRCRLCGTEAVPDGGWARLLGGQICGACATITRRELSLPVAEPEPAPTHRMLTERDTVQVGDVWAYDPDRLDCAVDVRPDMVGSTVLPGWQVKIWRRTDNDPGEGYRFLHDGETTEDGDECFHINSWQPLPGAKLRKPVHFGIGVRHYRRRVEPKAAPVHEQWRLLEPGEVVQEGDQRKIGTIRDEPVWRCYIPAEHGHTVCNEVYRRRAGVGGWRMLPVGTRLEAGDEYEFGGRWWNAVHAGIVGMVVTLQGSCRRRSTGETVLDRPAAAP